MNKNCEVYRAKMNGKKWYVYKGLCDGRPTKWMTLKKWDGIIKLQMKDGEIIYKDGKGGKMLVWEEGEKEYDEV